MPELVVTYSTPPATDGWLVTSAPTSTVQAGSHWGSPHPSAGKTLMPVAVMT